MSQPVIVVGIDFSETSELTLRQARRLAELREARLVLAHILDSSRLSHLKSSLLGSPSEEEVLELKRRALAEFVEKHGELQDLEQVVMAGSVADCLNQVIEEKQAELLVIAANDQKKARLGTNASRCLRQITCDVLVLRDWHGGAFKRVVVTTDFSGISNDALKQGALVARRHQASLEVIHVMYPPNEDSWGASTSHRMNSEKTYEEECIEAANEQMNSYIERNRETLKGVDFSTSLLQSTVPSEEITYHLQSTRADLVVVGTRTVPKLARIFVGTNAERLLNDAPVSVLAVRADGD